MAIINASDTGIAFTIRKKFKKTGTGVPTVQEGVYKVYRFDGKVVNVRCALYSPVNNKRPNQRGWQSRYAEAVAAYLNLTDEQKETYRVRAYDRHYTGYNLFMKEYLLTDYFLLLETAENLLLETGSNILI